jgi:riboflavin synthase
MFRGFIECKGFVIRSQNDELQLFVDATEFNLRYLKNVKIGDFIAVNGICLIVTQINLNEHDIILDFYVSESIRNAIFLNHHAYGVEVNIEREVDGGDSMYDPICHTCFQGIVYDRVTLISVTKAANGEEYNLIFTPTTNWDYETLTCNSKIVINGVSSTITFIDPKQNQFGVTMNSQIAEKTTFAKLFEDLPVDLIKEGARSAPSNPL